MKSETGRTELRAGVVGPGKSIAFQVCVWEVCNNNHGAVIADPPITVVFSNPRIFYFILTNTRDGVE